MAATPPQDRSSAQAAEAATVLSQRPALYKWRTCAGCGTIQQIVLAATRPSRCTSCGRSPIVDEPGAGAGAKPFTP